MLDAIGPRRFHALAMLLATVMLSLTMLIPSVDVIGGLVIAAALIVVGVHIGGAESLEGVVSWLILPHRAVMALLQGEDYEVGRHASGIDAGRRAENAAHIAAILAGGSASSPSSTVPTFRQHRMGKASAEDGAIGWWVDVPEGVGELQVRVQASPACSVALHVAANEAWIAAADPAEPVLVHRMHLPAGQVWLRASVVDASTLAGGTPPVLDLWIEPPPTR